MKEISDLQDWEATMDALEANWLSRIADCQHEYQGEHLALYGVEASALDRKSAQA